MAAYVLMLGWGIWTN